MRVISQKLRDSARGQECTLRIPGVCCYDRETTVIAHLPVPGFKGMATKVPDVFAVMSCHTCHAQLDQRRWEVDPMDMLRALAETQMKWLEMGLLRVEGMK